MSRMVVNASERQANPAALVSPDAHISPTQTNLYRTNLMTTLFGEGSDCSNKFRNILQYMLVTNRVIY
jgi:hypothetical protein